MTLAQSLKFLRNTAPEEFDNFVRAFNDFADGHNTALLNAGVSDVLVAQGRSQMCLKIKMLLEDAKTNKPTP